MKKIKRHLYKKRRHEHGYMIRTDGRRCFMRKTEDESIADIKKRYINTSNLEKIGDLRKFKMRHKE